MNRKKLALGAGAISLAAIALAADWGPYFMDKSRPDIDYEADSQAYYAYSQVLPRLYLNKKVEDIRKGDRVRIVYPDGEVWDFETMIQCSYAASPSCRFINPSKVASQNAPAKPTNYDIAYMREDTCPWESGYKDIPTGYWASKVEQTGTNEFTHSAWFVSTGTVSVYIKGSGCK